MTSKTNKTILFASLLVAMILPFSGMMMAEAAPNENANDKAKDRFNYQVEVLSTTILSEETVDGEKVTHFKQQIRQTDLPTMKEFKEMNADYFELLTGEEQSQIIAEFAKNIRNVQEISEIETVKYGEKSIVFQPYTKEWPWSSSTIKDPINILFKGNGNSAQADSIVDSYASHGWKNASGGPQWVFVDETSHGGSAYWSYSWDQLEEGSYYGERYHLRIFNGGNSAHDSFDKWSIGAVHKETWNGSGHTLASNAWETSESHLKSDLSGATGVTSVSTINLSNSGYYQSIWNGGVAGLVTLS